MSGNLPPLEWVIVEWDDAWGDATTSVGLSDAELNHKPMIHLTGGWLLHNNSKGVKLVTEYCPEDDTYRGQSFIPAGMVRTITPFKLTKPRRLKNEKTDSVPDRAADSSVSQS